MSAVLHAVDNLRSTFAMLAPLFEYPDDDYDRHLEEALDSTAGVDEDSTRRLDDFASEIRRLDRGALESTYTTTFDLGASCLPYLGAHVFEPESRDRARLMVGLRMTFRNGGYETDGELPDHIAEVFRFAPKFEEQDWIDLVRLVLVPAISKMEKALEGSTNPYRHLISAAGHLCRLASADGGES